MGAVRDMKSILGATYDRLPLKQPVMHLLRPLGLPAAVWQHLHFRGTIDVAVPGGMFRMLHCAQEIENELFWEGLPGRRERVSMALWMQLCPTAKTIVDVGANSGVFALVARALNRSARVLAFEPLPDLHARLVKNAELNGYAIDARRLALSDHEGIAHMSGWTIRANGALEVPTARLETVMDDLGAGDADLMKIDVEGHEPAVLRGMGDMLRRARPALLLEVLTDTAAGELRPLLEGLGYLYFDIDEIGEPRRLPELRRSSHWNLLACSAEAAEKLGLARA